MPVRRPSLRLRLLAVALISIVATLAVAEVSLVAVFERQILKRIEQELEVRFTELAAAFRLDADGKPTLIRQLTDPRYHQPYGGVYWQIEEDGKSVMTSRSLWDDTIDISDRSNDHSRGRRLRDDRARRRDTLCARAPGFARTTGGNSSLPWRSTMPRSRICVAPSSAMCSGFSDRSRWCWRLPPGSSFATA